MGPMASPTGRAEDRPSWWTPARLRLAGGLAIVAGLSLGVGLPLAMAVLSVEFPPPGWLVVLSNLLSDVFYALLLPVLGASHARFQRQYGRVGQLLVFLVAVVLAVLSIGFAVKLFLEIRPSGSVLFLYDILQTALYAFPLFTSGFGLVLWWRTSVRDRTAGLLILSAPAYFLRFIPAFFDHVVVGGGLEALFQLPLHLGFAALGYDIWRPEQRDRG